MTSFEDAARRMLGAPPEAHVYSDWNEAWNDGCDTCGNGRTPANIEIGAYLRERYPNGRLKPGLAKTWNRTFTSLPELWDALFTHDTKDES